MKYEDPLHEQSAVASSGSDYRIESAAGKIPEYSPSFQTYRSVFSERRWEILTSVAVVLALALIFSYKMKPIYRATARIEIEAEGPQTQPLDEHYRNAPPDDSYLTTQARVLASNNLAWRTLQQAGLANDPAYARYLQPLQRQPADSPPGQDLLVGEFKRHLSVELLRNSRMVEVSFEDTDPQLAARVANALVDNYIEYYFHKKYDSARQASGWMEHQLDDLKAKVEKSQQALVDYERQSAIVTINEKQSVTEQRVADLSKDLTTAESERLKKQSLYDVVRANEPEVNLVAQNGLLQRLEERNADLQAQQVDALGQFGPNFPKVVRLRDQINEVQSLIDREHKRIVSQIHNDYLAALGREKLAATSLAKEKAEVGVLNQLLIQRNILKHDFETNQQLYETLLQRLKNAAVTAGLTATNIHIVDRAFSPAVPARPRKLLNLSIGLIVGLVLGITVAFVREGLDYSVKTAEDVESLLETPSLALIPEADSARLNRYSFLPGKRNGESPGSGTALTVLNEPASPLAESYRALRTSILLSTAPRPPQVLLVTSAQPSEGKTCTSLNLALALAQRRSRVLIVDADLRKPGIARALGLNNEKGLSGVLTSSLSLEEAIQPVEDLPDLWVLPSGRRPPNPAELISSPTMERIVADLRDSFDYLVVDSPPLLCVTDPTILSTLVDGIILVVQSGLTTGAALLRAHRMLKSAGGRILGVVMNKVNLRQQSYYYGSYYEKDMYTEASPEAVTAAFGVLTAASPRAEAISERGPNGSERRAAWPRK